MHKLLSGGGREVVGGEMELTSKDLHLSLQNYIDIQKCCSIPYCKNFELATVGVLLFIFSHLQFTYL